jgi:hypothetical protein
MATAPAFAQINTSSIRTIQFGPYNLAEAYPCTVSSADVGVTDQQLFTGTCAAQSGPAAAAPGILCLQKHSGTEVLDANCFAVIPSDEAPPIFVQAYQLIKQVPGSFKCPDVYGLPHFDSNGKLIPYQYYQFGGGVRTWWSLNFTQPGTQFILQVVAVDRSAPVMGEDKNGNPVTLVPGGSPRLHMDVWTWRVVADVNTLLYVINVMHGGAVGTLEVPCIIGEDMYDALISARQTLSNAIDTGDLTAIGNAIFNMESLIVANCLFVEVLNPVVAFPGPDQFGAPNIQPPGNTAPTVTFGSMGSAIAGIIDTIEHPCCCKLLVDLEWITIRQGLIGQSPTLPTF